MSQSEIALLPYVPLLHYSPCVLAAVPAMHPCTLTGPPPPHTHTHPTPHTHTPFTPTPTTHTPHTTT